MRSIYDFIITPKTSRYNNTKQVGDKELILNVEIFNHQYVSREAIVQKTPVVNNTNIQSGDEVIVHHNVFRRWHNIRGEEKNSKNYLGENEYAIRDDQVFAYKRNNIWKALQGYCFVKPIESNSMFNIDKEQPLIGVMKYCDSSLKGIKSGDLVGFIPDVENEFIINNERLYRILTQHITIKYEYQGNEKEYNPRWTKSSG